MEQLELALAVEQLKLSWRAQVAYQLVGLAFLIYGAFNWPPVAIAICWLAIVQARRI